MWKAEVIIDNKINNIISEIKLEFPIQYTYNNLFNDVKILIYEMKWDISKWDVPKCKISFYKNKTLVTDRNKYIYMGDKITIVLYDPTKFRYALFSESGKILFVVSDLKKIYNDINIKYLKEDLEIYKVNECDIKIEFIDILINENRMYNEVINRLILNYNW